MSNNTLQLAPYDKFFGIIYKSFKNEGKELTPEMQLAPAPTSLAAKGEVKLQRFVQQTGSASLFILQKKSSCSHIINCSS